MQPADKDVVVRAEGVVDPKKEIRAGKFSRGIPEITGVVETVASGAVVIVGDRQAISQGQHLGVRSDGKRIIGAVDVVAGDTVCTGSRGAGHRAGDEVTAGVNESSAVRREAVDRPLHVAEDAGTKGWR